MSAGQAVRSISNTVLWFITLDVSLHLLVDDIVLSLCVLSVSSCFAVADLVLYILPGFGFGQGFYGDPFFVLTLILAKYLLVCIYPCPFLLLPYTSFVICYLSLSRLDQLGPGIYC